MPYAENNRTLMSPLPQEGEGPAAKKVLIIEDDPAIAEIERDYLRRNGLQADFELDGTKGLERALQHPYDLVLLDLMLPGTDGLTICGRLRETTDIPIIFLSAKKDDRYIVRCFDCGADDYIVKPFSPRQLVARVRSHLARYSLLKQGGERPESDGEAPSEIVCDGLRIQPGDRRVFLDGKEIHLKCKEYKLLHFLAANPGVVFDRETIYRQVWGMPPCRDNATVYVHINRIREKIEREPAGPYFIQTVRGAGYRFRLPE